MRSRMAGAFAAAWISCALPVAAAPIDAHVATVPEPELLALLAVAAVALIARQVRRMRRLRSARLH